MEGVILSSRLELEASSVAWEEELRLLSEQSCSFPGVHGGMTNGPPHPLPPAHRARLLAETLAEASLLP